MKEVLEKMKKDLNYKSLDHLIYSLCEHHVDFGKGYEWKNNHPDYDLRKTDKALYDELTDKRKEERNTTYQQFINTNKDKYDYEWIEQDGGGEGGSEYCYGVFKLEGKFYKAEYSYYSYKGHDYDGISDTLVEVKPVEKTITVFERV